MIERVPYCVFPRRIRRGLIEALHARCRVSTIRNFRGEFAAASLKHPVVRQQVVRDGRFPRRIRRGLIEAEAQLIALGASTAFPRRIRRGLIEAFDPRSDFDRYLLISAANSPRPH